MLTLVLNVNTISNQMFSLAHLANNKRDFYFGKLIANQKIPTILEKAHEGDVTGQQYNARNSDISLPRAPHRLGGGDI